MDKKDLASPSELADDRLPDDGLVEAERLAANGEATQAKPAEETEEAQSRYRRQRSEALKEPLIKSAVELLGAQLIDVEDGFGSVEATVAERVEAPDGEEA